MPDYLTDRHWSDRFIPQLKHIVADLLITPAPEEDDMFRNTDLIVLRIEDKRVACRVRRHKYLTDYPLDITFRSGRPSGVKTELEKLTEGFGDYFVYAFASADETHLCAWRIIDLRVFRAWLARRREEGQDLPGREVRNGDGSSSFRAIKVKEMPCEAIVCEFGFTTGGKPVQEPALAGKTNSWGVSSDEGKVDGSRCCSCLRRGRNPAAPGAGVQYPNRSCARKAGT